MIVTIPSELKIYVDVEVSHYHCQHKNKSIAFTSGQN